MKKSVFERCRDEASWRGLTKTQFRQQIAPHRTGLRTINGNEVEVKFRLSQRAAAISEDLL